MLVSVHDVFYQVQGQCRHLPVGFTALNAFFWSAEETVEDA